MALLCICFLSLGYVVFRLCQINLPFELYLFELPYLLCTFSSAVACISLFCIKMCFAPQSIKVGERSRIGSFSLPFVWGRNFFSCNNTQLAQWFLSMCVRLSRSVLFRFLCWVTVLFYSSAPGNFISFYEIFRPVWHIKNAGVFSSLYRESISPLCPLSSNFNFSQNFLGRLLDRDIYIWIT